MISWGAQGGTGGAFAPPPACMLKKALTYFHNSEDASLLISSNRLSTNCLNSLLEFRIQLSTTVESDQ